MRRPLETPDNNYSRGELEHAGLVDDVPPTAPDWAEMARAPWDASEWKAAAAEYHNNNHEPAAKIQPERLQRLRYLTDNDVSLKRAWSEVNDQRRRGEAATTAVEVQMSTVLRDEPRS